MKNSDSNSCFVLYISRRRAEELPMLKYLKQNELLNFYHVDVAIGSFFVNFFNIFKSFGFSITRQPKIILVESMGIVSFIGLICSFLARGKLVLRIKGNIFQEYEDSRKSDSFIYKFWKYTNFQASRFALKNCDLILPISRVPLMELERSMNITKPMEIVYIAARSFDKSPQEDSKIPDFDFVLTVSNFNYLRKVQPLVPAIRKIAPQLSEYGLKWMILGDGKFLTRIKHEVSAEIETGLVEFVGTSNPKPYYTKARAHFYFSGLDGLPNSLLESYFFKVPVLLNKDFPVMGESAVANENVLIIDLENDDQLSVKIKLDQILLDKKIRSRLINKSQELLERRFSIKSVSLCLLRAFDKIQ